MSQVLPPEPLILKAFAHYALGLDDHTRFTFWKSLCLARWSRAVEFKAALTEASTPHGLMGRETFEDFAEAHGRPAALVRLLEDLVAEGTLTRRDASVIEEKLFTKIDRDGDWVAP
jgi:hypothetical protein